MVVSRKNECLLIIIIFVNEEKLKQRDQFKYVGGLISSHGRNNTEIASRIEQAKNGLT